MKTETLIELQRSITNGPWCLTHLPFMDCDNDIDLKGNNGNTLIANFPTLEKSEGVAHTPSDEDSANLRAIALVPELIAEVIRLREALNQCIDALSPARNDSEQIAINQARAALANDK